MNDHHRSSATEDEYRDWDASYVLGALPADQRLEYEQHLSGCAACRWWPPQTPPAPKYKNIPKTPQAP